LYEELPGLVKSGILSPDVAERLHRHYGEQDDARRKRWTLVLFGILGGVLIGGGTLLIIAHNWDELSRGTRAVLSFAPLLIGQALGAFVLLRKAESPAWREGVGAYWALAVGASIALVAQTYNLAGDFSRFMLSWTLLGLLVVYLMQACLPALLYLVGITVWTASAWDARHEPAWFWVLALLLLPYLWALVRRDRYQPRVALAGWVLSACVCIAVAFMLERGVPGLWRAIYGLLFTIIYTAGAVWFGEAPNSWKRPLQTAGGLGVIIVVLILTFEDPWGGWRADSSGDVNAPAMIPLWLTLAVGGISAAWLLSRRAAPWQAVFGAFALVVALGQLVARRSVGAAMALFNAYVLALGVTTLWAGLSKANLAIANVGMAIIALLIVTRFFDSDLSFVVRGLGFIAVGTVFLIANVVLARRQKTGAAS